MQRLDHSMIYVLIAGTYVPICLVALPPAWGIPMLVVVGLVRCHGMVLKLAGIGRRELALVRRCIRSWDGRPSSCRRCSSPISPACSSASSSPAGWRTRSGFPVLLVRRPDPWPTVFGYHEVWHLFTVVAAVLHFAAVTDVLAS